MNRASFFWYEIYVKNVGTLYEVLTMCYVKLVPGKPYYIVNQFTGLYCKRLTTCSIKPLKKLF